MDQNLNEARSAAPESKCRGLARSAILKAELQAKGEWKEEHENPGDYEVGDEEMSIFEYEERYGGDEDEGDKK